MVSLVVRQAQGAGQGRQDLLGRCRAPTLFEADKVVDGDTGQQRDLLAAQPRHPAIPAGGHAHVRRGQPGPGALQGGAESLTVHASSMAPGRAPRLVLPIPGSAGPGRPTLRGRR
jgi:hypothetical protein